MRISSLAVPAVLSLSILAAAAVPAGAAGRIDGSGARLTGERSGDRLCLTLTEPSKDLRLRRCLLGAGGGQIRTSFAYVEGRCDVGPRLFGLAPRGTVKVNLGGVLDSGRPIALRTLRVPGSVHPARGVAFVVRRSLDGMSPTLTAYGADGERLAQRRFDQIPSADCVETLEPEAAR
jgi:hypothetical protein